MNILPFVMVMLMLLATMTYGRLQSFRSHKGMMQGFTLFLEQKERQKFNEASAEKYDTIIVKETGGGGQGNPAEKASSALNLSMIFNPEKDVQRNEFYTQIFKQLVHDTLGQEPYFQKLQEERHSCIDEL